jgi:hypothetical protein
MSTDQDWARDLFERSRQGEEPTWVADHAAMMRAGRRRRNRTMAASGSAVAVLSVAAAVGVGVLDDGAPRTHQPRPVTPGLPTSTATHAAADPAKVLDYARFAGWSTKDAKGQSPDYFKKYYVAIPHSAALDSMRLLSRLDPTLSHIEKPSGSAYDIRLVPDDDPMAKDMSLLNLQTQWKGGGNLSLDFRDDAGSMPGDPGDGCRPTEDMMAGMLHPVHQSGGGWSEEAKWSACNKMTGNDGSVITSSTKSYGPFSVVYAIRRFPGDTGAVEMLWWNYKAAFGPIGPTPDPKQVLSPNPITAEKLEAALTDPALVPPLTSAPAGAPPQTMLQAADFGSGWTYDAAQSHGSTGALVVDDGCTNEQNMVATPQPLYTYTGTTPSGISVTANVGVDSMKHGSGPSWMTELRKHGTGGCDQGDQKQLKYTQDTMTPLPGGIGDDAFIENWVGLDDETIFIRFGDDILRLDVNKPDHTMPAFTQADKTWFAELAKKAAARHAGKG